MLPLLGLGERLYPEFDVAFVINPDKSQTVIPSHEEIRRGMDYRKRRIVERVRKNVAVRLAPASLCRVGGRVSRKILRVVASPSCCSRTNHLSYHLGQAVLGLK